MLGRRDTASDFLVLGSASCGCNAFDLLSSALFDRAICVVYGRRSERQVLCAAADPDMTANPDSELELRNRLRFQHLQQHRSTSGIDDISIIMTAFPSSIHRLPEAIGPELLNAKMRNTTLGHDYDLLILRNSAFLAVSRPLNGVKQGLKTALEG
jgi:hypothetical protein